nr:hypothetical protein [Tanacetum cinerariifolium]GEW43011.1 hypothetical protein [Tanacetum cinerariifolium]
MMKPDHQDPNTLDNTKPWRRYCSCKFTMNFWNGKVATEIKSQGCDKEIDGMLRINLCEAGTNEEIFTSLAWIRAFNINKPIYSKLCHEFYSTYESDKVYADDELKTQKIIKFRLGGRAHSLTLLEFARRLELYHAKERDEGEPNFEDVAQDDHLWVMLKDNWVDKKKRSWYSERESDLVRTVYHEACYEGKGLIDEVLRSLSALIYCRDLDTTMLRELINSEGRLILKDPQSDVPRVAISRAQRASMQDLYERMGSTEIRQGAIERMDYRQSYQWDRYAGVFKHMARVYKVPLQGAYNPPRYAQPQYDQYY